MQEFLSLVSTSVITFLVYEAMRTLFDNIKSKKKDKKKGNKR